MSYSHYFYTVLRYILYMIYIFMNNSHFYIKKEGVFTPSQISLAALYPVRIALAISAVLSPLQSPT